jgi:threonine aldolase
LDRRGESAQRHRFRYRSRAGRDQNTSSVAGQSRPAGTWTQPEARAAASPPATDDDDGPSQSGPPTAGGDDDNDYDDHAGPPATGHDDEHHDHHHFDRGRDNTDRDGNRRGAAACVDLAAKLAAVTSARGFASDNSATIHPAVLEAIAAANVGHAFGYGHDEYTQRVERLVAAQFSVDARTFFVFNGSGANVLCLRAVCRPWHGVICASTAHLNVDECGAPEHIAGVKLLTIETEHGKLTPDLVERRIARIGDEHAVQPRVISISQCTELGTIYSAEEVDELGALAREHGLILHVDGARLANAAAAMDVKLIAAAPGADLISFGGTKNGLLAAEAVVLLRPELADEFPYLRKQTLQLASKMRFLAAQFDALMRDQLWLRCASHANAMAARLAAALEDVAGVTITRPVETNAVFATLPPDAIRSLQQRFAFYVWDEARNEVRWMCSWDTTAADVDEFVGAVAAALS